MCFIRIMIFIRLNVNISFYLLTYKLSMKVSIVWLLKHQNRTSFQIWPGKYMNTDENIKAHSLSFLTFLRVPTFLSSLVSRLGWHCIAPHCKIILNKYTMMVPNTYFIPCSLIILFNTTFSTPYHKYFQITQTTQSAFLFMSCKIRKLLYPGNHSDNQMQQKIITSSPLLTFCLCFLYQTCFFEITKI